MAFAITLPEGLENYGDNETGTDDYIDYTSVLESFCSPENLGLITFYAVFQPVLYSLLFVLGVLGNGLMITVLMRRRGLLRITEIYLLHLALADLMLLFTFPFSVAESITGWVFGGFLCKMMGLMKNLNLHSGSFLLACIGFDRYLAIVHAIPSMRNRRPRAVHLTCLVLWLVCFGFSVPNVVFLAVTKEDTNSSRYTCAYFHYAIHAHNWVLANRVLGHVCFFLPLAIMSYCYTAVVVTLCRSQKSQTKQGAIRLSLLVTIVFCLCWLPYNISLVIQTMYDLKVSTSDTCISYGLIQATLVVTESLGFSHCCLNPFLYAFVGVQFRNELYRLLCDLGCNPACLPFLRAQRHSRPSISEGGTTVSISI